MKENSKYCDSPEEDNSTIEAKEYNSQVEYKNVSQNLDISSKDKKIKENNKYQKEINLIEALKETERNLIEEDNQMKSVVHGQKYQIDLGNIIYIELKLWKILE